MFQLLRVVDVDRRPSMGFTYGMLENAKNKNKNFKVACNRKEIAFRLIIDIKEKESRGRLNNIMHLVSYYLNYYYYYRDRKVLDNTLIRTAVIHCICIFYPTHYL